MTRVVLSIGSNVGDSLAHLRSVTAELGDRVISVSPVYVSAPWGGVEQQDFLNAVIVAEDPDRDARDWLVFAGEREQAADRLRIERWGPRSLDVDIVVCDDVISTDPELTLPHPRAHQRAFVLVPWLDVDPDASLNVGSDVRPVAAWLGSLPDDEISSVSRTDLRLDTPE
ncbi:2-amino-4-hydroxy-6-hydroxymethyldihydropteridine diphosphokinase [Rhodococcus sp. G-MC3]|uniref:2-amino-4-hydroxy-6- hydroxymethyldihydropteridine diphosphokinase n=1 Tax=Rhodococcus sp. G-MC3 TaxID=3046209 RepID=UPI0024B9C5C4|nr:2-amino-4-hydroxy-6-hydroxymethyldihydropteridine diphosphokinase [Rhodococcus sp. G-MC3]MDJ0393433.1 2-amino-4-hydroxy-6-hydroxymethyldihydropteridine diphosphokinase [Rhodococcus sp. G-MC3]